MKIQYEIEINAPVDKIWAIFDGDAAYFQTHPTIKSYVATNGKHGHEGTVARLITSEGPYEIESTSTVIEREAPRAISYMFQSGVASYTLHCRMEPRGDGFLYTNEAKLVFHGLYKLVMPIFGPLICSRIYDNMRHVKDYLEGRSEAFLEKPALQATGKTA